MKKILYLFFALATTAAATAYGQSPPGAIDLSRWKLQLTPPSALTINGFSTEDTARVRGLTAPRAIRKQMPDNMPCLTPDMVRVERMPVKWSRNADPMPNKSHPAPMFILPSGNK
jgi:hypothetical protein